MITLCLPATVTVRHVIFQDLRLPGLEVAVEAVLGSVTSGEMLPHVIRIASGVVTDLTADSLTLNLNQVVFIFLISLAWSRQDRVIVGAY